MTNRCIEWWGHIRPNGYGHIKIGPKNWLAHRLVYEVCYGRIPDGLVVLHSCDNPSCVNPVHLSVGTLGDNIRDAIKKGRMPHVYRNRDGAKNPNAKLTDDEAVWVRKVSRSGLSSEQVSDLFCISPSRVRQIAREDRYD